MRPRDKIVTEFFAEPHLDVSGDGILLEVLLDIRELLLDNRQAFKEVKVI